MAHRQPTTPTPGQLLSRPQPQWQPLTAQGQLNAEFVMEMPIWQERGIAPGLVYTPPPPPPRLPPPPPPPTQQLPHYAAPPPAAAHQSAVAGYTSASAAAPRPVRRTRVDSLPSKSAPAPAKSAAAPAPPIGKPYGTRSKTVAHPVSTLSLPAAQNLLAETFNRDPHRVVCPLAGCERACASPAALQQHVLGAHVGAVHACARCNRVYKTAAGLEGHMCAGRYR